jgi:4-hydroxythreonine-4-phosphate dehydrogenase
MNTHNVNKELAPIAITMGEPSGVGPEIFCNIWKQRSHQKLPKLLYIGSLDSLLIHDKMLDYVVIKSPSEAKAVPDYQLPVIEIQTQETIKPGALTPANGYAVISAIDAAVSLALSGEISALVTSPIHKAALYDIGFASPGHTEYLAERSGFKANASVMMLATNGLRVIPVTTHIALKDVSRKLTTDMIVHAGLVVYQDLQSRFGVKNPKLAVAALNPHAGENGAMGIEEVTHIMPAIHILRDMGIKVTDPQPSDTLFHEEARSRYDAVLCMYHDQALIPLKTLDFWGGVNITLGLPFIRTSPDHGTGLNIAGQKTARSDSFYAAIKSAEVMATNELNAKNAK